MKLFVKLLDKKARLPSYAHEGDAGMDLYCLERIVIKPGKRSQIKTGVAIKIPKGYVGLIWDKSGLAVKNGLTTIAGVIDSGYRGEIIIGMLNTDKKEYVFEPGHKVAQMLIQSVKSMKIVEINQLNQTKRGSKGFGSTGK